MLRLYGKCVGDAVAVRLRSDGAQAALHGPGFVLGAGAALLLLAALATHGFRGTRLLFQPLPIEQPERLVSVQYPSRPKDRAATLARLIPLWREKSAVARDIAGYRYAYNDRRAWVTWNFFAVVGTRPAAGRFFRSGDGNAAVLSYAAWRSLYRGNPRIVGATIQVEGRAYRVVGVLPELVWALSPAVEVWIPLELESPLPSSSLFLGAVARLRPGTTSGQLAKELSGLAKTAISGPPRAVRAGSFANRLPGSGIAPYLIGTVFAMISALVMVVREHHRAGHPGGRYWWLLSLKTILAIAIPLLVWIELGAVLRNFQPALGTVVGLAARIAVALAFLVTCVRALWWSFADQRRRCPVCLGRLAMPVSVGSPASVFDPMLTELICPNGHGALALPDDETDRPDHWTGLDSSWAELFKNKPA